MYNHECQIDGQKLRNFPNRPFTSYKKRVHEQLKNFSVFEPGGDFEKQNKENYEFQIFLYHLISQNINTSSLADSSNCQLKRYIELIKEKNKIGTNYEDNTDITSVSTKTRGDIFPTFRQEEDRLAIQSEFLAASEEVLGKIRAMENSPDGRYVEVTPLGNGEPEVSFAPALGILSPEELMEKEKQLERELQKEYPMNLYDSAEIPGCGSTTDVSKDVDGDEKKFREWSLRDEIRILRNLVAAKEEELRRLLDSQEGKKSSGPTFSGYQST